MSRKIDHNKLRKIKAILEMHPEGLWVRELARICSIDKSTVSRYLNNQMENEIEVRKIGKLLKIVRLKGGN